MIFCPYPVGVKARISKDFDHKRALGRLYPETVDPLSTTSSSLVVELGLRYLISRVLCPIIHIGPNFFSINSVLSDNALSFELFCSFLATRSSSPFSMA